MAMQTRFMTFTGIVLLLYIYESVVILIKKKQFLLEEASPGLQ